jgi:hypothetical protein
MCSTILASTLLWNYFGSAFAKKQKSLIWAAAAAAAAASLQVC